jgi:hypothetical protein
MTVLSLTNPTPGTTADANMIASNNAAIIAVVNGGLTDGNIQAAAGIAASKLASYPADATKGLFGDGTWKNLVGNTAATGLSANQDLASPATGQHYHTANTSGGGSIRSAGIPALGAGSRLSIRAGIPSSTLTIKHQTAGGTGQQFYNRTLGDITLLPNESVDYLYDGTNWTEQSRDQATASTVITPATSLPGSPTDGQQSVLTDSTTVPTYAWLLQWSSTASKWFFLGGSPLASYATAGLASNVAPGASYVAYTGAPSVTVPRAGVYTVRHGAGISQNTTTITTNVTVKNGANAASDIDSVELQNIPTANGAATVAKTTQFTCAASAALAHQWKNSSGNATIVNAFIEATPVYVT